MDPHLATPVTRRNPGSVPSAHAHRSSSGLPCRAARRAQWCARASLACAVLLSGCGSGGGSSTPAPAAPVGFAFVDVAATVGLDHVIDTASIFPGFTASGPLAMIRNMGSGAAVGDFDDDGDLDLYLLGHYDQPNRLYRNDLVETGTLGFTDITPPLLADLGLSRVAHFRDLDGDGLLDLLLINDDEGGAGARPSRLFRNLGGGAFEDRTAGSNFRPEGVLKGGCALADYDRDGNVDIFVSNWGMLVVGATTPEFPGENRLYRNLGNFVFEDVTGNAIPSLASNSFSAIFTDFDDDARPDLLLAVDGGPDRFYRNDAGTGFVDVSAAVGVTHIGNDMGLAIADHDGDGDLDVFSTNITDPTGFYGMGSGNVLYENQLADTGSLDFIDRATECGVVDVAWGWGTQFADLDLDGDLDLVAVNGFDQWIESITPTSPILDTPAVLFESDGVGNYAPRTGTDLDLPRDGRALVAFDADRDGDLDLLVTNLEQNVQLLENRAVTNAHSLTVALVPDALALGARVEITFDPDGAGPAPERTVRHECVAGRSYLSGTPAEVVAGLAEATTADVRVVWADGSETRVPAVAADQRIIVDGS